MTIERLPVDGAPAGSAATDSATADRAPIEAQTRTVRCPRCGTVSEQSRYYTAWCEQCGWNVDPEPPPPVSGRVARWLQARADRQTRSLFERVAARGPAARTTGGARLLLLGLALLVHLLTIALLVLAAWLWLVPGLLLLFKLGGTVLLVGLAVVLAPRIPSSKVTGVEITRSSAPQTFALLDRLSDEAHAPRVQRLFVRSFFNAACSRVGLRRTPILILGARLWTVLDPQERVALLGHEIGHLRNGDASRGLLVGGAIRSMGTWTELLLPDVARWHRRRYWGFGIGASSAASLAAAERIAALVMFPLAMLVYGLGRGLDLLTVRDSQRAEYFADDLGSRLAGSEASARLLGMLTLRGSAELTLRRVAQTTEPGQLWAEVAGQVAAVPSRERVRLGRLAAERMQTADGHHPPTHLRRQLQDGRPQQPAVVPDAQTWAAVDAELAPVLTRMAASVSAERGVRTVTRRGARTPAAG